MSSCSTVGLFCWSRSQGHMQDTMPILGRVRAQFLLADCAVQGMKAHFWTAGGHQQPFPPVNILKMLVLYALVRLCSQWLLSGLYYSVATDIFIAPCENGDIKLSGSSDPLQGRIEICMNQVWGTICDDFWDVNDVAVICQQLGFSAEGDHPILEIIRSGDCDTALYSHRCICSSRI